MPFCLNLNFDLLSLIHSAHSRSPLHTDTDADASPPSKRRRTLAGSIASTALSAALIGTAVGITVYRLWRDRGKSHPQPQSSQSESQSLPPPPAYEQGEWVPPHTQQKTAAPAPTTPRSIRRARNVNTPTKRATRHGHRKTRSQPQHHHYTVVPSAPAVRPEFDFGAVVDQEEEPADQMDWIGTKLSQLIHEGQKALGREIVVASEAQEDEVDDGDVDGWVEEYPDHDDVPSSKRSRRHGHSRSGSASASITSSPRTSRFDHHHHPSTSTSASAPMLIPNPITHSPCLTPSISASASVREDESAWMSPELRESMEKARARYTR